MFSVKSKKIFYSIIVQVPPYLELREVNSELVILNVPQYLELREAPNIEVRFWPSCGISGL